MLPEDHFLSLAVREAMKPRKDWEVAPTDPEIFPPDCFGVVGLISLKGILLMNAEGYGFLP
jgi:hypothetical protein